MADDETLPYSEHPDAAALANPFQQQLQLLRCPRHSEAFSAEALPLSSLQPLQPQAPWWHYGHVTRLGPMVIGAWVAPPARASVQTHDTLTALILYGGDMCFQQEQKQWVGQAGDCLLISADSYAWQSSLCSAVFFLVERHRLLETATTMAGRRRPRQDWPQRLEQNHCWSLPQHDQAPSLAGALVQAIGLCSELANCNPVLVERLQIDEQVYRLLAAMVIPELGQGDHLDRLQQRQRHGRDSFDELIDYILANLHQPLNLTLLEARSHYSRRALQYAFRQRLGCTATQWIRSQRLDLARQRLQQAQPGDSVATIANACGYRSLNLFRIDFQQRFHVKPSALLREAQQAT